MAHLFPVHFALTAVGMAKVRVVRFEFEFEIESPEIIIMASTCLPPGYLTSRSSIRRAGLAHLA